jgi:hypothetical protein
MLVVSFFLTFLLITQASYVIDLVSSSESFGDDVGTVYTPEPLNLVNRETRGDKESTLGIVPRNQPNSDQYLCENLYLNELLGNTPKQNNFELQETASTISYDATEFTFETSHFEKPFNMELYDISSLSSDGSYSEDFDEKDIVLASIYGTTELFVESADAKLFVQERMRTTGLCPKPTVTPPKFIHGKEEPRRAKNAARAIWFTRPRHSSSKRVKSIETVDRMIQKFAWLGQCFRPDVRGENAVSRTRIYGAKMSNDYMVLSDLLKVGNSTTGMATLKSRGFFDIKKLVAVEESAGNTLSIVFSKKRVVFHSVGIPPLAAVVLRVNDGHYEPVMVSKDNGSIKKTLKSKDVIVVGLCETVWGGLSFPADSSLEKIVTDVAKQKQHGMAIAAIVN